MKINDILKKPILTEKTTQLVKDGFYTFEVDPRANKNQIKEAVEKVFGVEVQEVKVLRRKGKLRKVGRRMVEKRLPERKIAYVKLKKGRIDIFPQA